MPMGQLIALVCWLMGVSFAAGKAYAESLRARKDTDGVRKLLNAHVELTRERFLHTVIVLMTLNEGQDIKTVLDLLKREMEKR
jgi:hypothetical protein